MAQQQVDLLADRRRERGLLYQHGAQRVLDAQRQRDVRRQVEAQDVGQQRIERAVQRQHGARRHQRAFDAIQFGLQVGDRRRQVDQRFAQHRVARFVLLDQALLFLQRGAELGERVRRFRPARHAERAVQAAFELVDARQRRGERLVAGVEADARAQDVGVPFGVELFQFAQVQHDAVLGAEIDGGGAVEQETEQQRQHDQQSGWRRCGGARSSGAVLAAGKYE